MVFSVEACDRTTAPAADGPRLVVATVRTALFLVLPVVSGLAPLVTLPVVARAGDGAQWTAVGVGTAVGSIAATVSSVGWNVQGAAALARLSDDATLAYYARSFWLRLAVTVVTAPASMVVSWLVLGGGPAATVGAACAGAFALGGLSVGWWAVGNGRPGVLLTVEVLPRLGASVVAALLVGLTGMVLVWPALLVAATVLGLGGFHRRLLGRTVPRRPNCATVRQDLRSHSSAWVVEATGSLYSALPVPVAAALLDSTSSAAYVSSDRLYRFALFVVVAVANAEQRWVLVTDERRRHVLAVVSMGVVGLTGGALLVTLGPWASAVLFGVEAAADRAVFVPIGIAYCCTALLTPFLRNVLFPRRHGRATSRAVLLSGAAGIATMLVAGSTTRAPVGIAQGLAVSEAVMLAAALVITIAVRRPTEENA
jgi:hypothetical protein